MLCPLPQALLRAIAEIMHWAAPRNRGYRLSRWCRRGRRRTLSPACRGTPTNSSRSCASGSRRRFLSNSALMNDADGSTRSAPSGNDADVARPRPDLRDISLRFITYSLRGLAPEQVFARHDVRVRARRHGSASRGRQPGDAGGLQVCPTCATTTCTCACSGSFEICTRR